MLFTRTSDLVQELQLARREFALEAAIQRPYRYHRLILDESVRRQRPGGNLRASGWSMLATNAARFSSRRISPSVNGGKSSKIPS